MYPGCTIRAMGAGVNSLNHRQELPVCFSPCRRATPLPRVVPAGGDIQQATLCGYRIVGLVRPHELVSSDGIEPASRANQAAAFANISRSRFNCRFSRRSRRISSRSWVVSPSASLPSSRSACFTHLLILSTVGSNSRAYSPGLRPTRTNSTIRWRNSSGYALLPRGIVDISLLNLQVSTELGQLHYRIVARLGEGVSNVPKRLGIVV